MYKKNCKGFNFGQIQAYAPKKPKGSGLGLGFWVYGFEQ